MSVLIRLGAMMLAWLLACAWPAALAQDRHGQGQGRGNGHGYGHGYGRGDFHHGGQGGQHDGGRRGGGEYYGGQHRGGSYYGGAPHWRGDYGRLRGNDWGAWRGGHWRHGYHGGSLGWWWIVGPTWYYYPQPVYPYPGPWAAPAQYWYYCPSSRIYYPYVPLCPGWQQLPVMPDARVLVPIPQVP